MCVVLIRLAAPGGLQAGTGPAPTGTTVQRYKRKSEPPSDSENIFEEKLKVKSL